MASKEAGMIRNNIYIIKRAAQYDWRHILTLFLIRLVNAVFNVWFSVILSIRILERLIAGTSFSELAKFVFLALGAILMQMTIGGIYNMYFGKIREQKMMKQLQLDLYKKVAKVDLKEYQDDQFYDKVTRAITEARERFTSAVSDYVDFACKIVSIILITIFLGTLEWSMFIYVLVPVLVNYLLEKKTKELFFKRNQSTTNIKRRANYCYRISYLPEYTKDNKLYGVYEFLTGRYKGLKEEELEHELYYNKRIYAADFIRELIQLFFITIAPACIVLYQVTKGQLQIPEIAALMAGISLLHFNINSVISFLPIFKENGLFVENYKVLMEYQKGMEDGDQGIDSFEELELKKVSFGYVQGQSVLKDIELKLRRGEKIAIVGRNGSGKSTLLKILMRLYDPDTGELQMNGRDIREYRSKPYREVFGVVFQDSRLYAFSLKENLCLTKKEGRTDMELQEVLQQVGLWDKVSSHLLGIDAEVGNEFSEGINFSGGERQKLAIARALVQKGEIMVFDEALAALDPEAEHEINQMLFEVFANKTMIVVSHRLSTVMNADRIYYLDDGQIKEYGTHQELMEQKGGYHFLFQLQASQYDAAGTGGGS